VKQICKIACGKQLLAENPATNTLGARQNAAARRRRKRLPFSTADLDLIFRSRIFTDQHRSHGQSGEASYWLRILMYYSGVRPQELAGLELGDLRHDPHHGWYLDIIDRPGAEDRTLFDRDLLDDESTIGAPKPTRDDDDEDDDDISAWSGVSLACCFRKFPHYPGSPRRSCHRRSALRVAPAD
jgi:hypothetical protein